MNAKGTILTALLLSWLCTGTTAAQDIALQDPPERKNSISWTVLSALDRTISFTYARKLKNGREITFNPRVKFPSKNVATEPGDVQGSNILIFVSLPDPQWYYTHYSLRTGLWMPLSDHFGFEPQLQLGYGLFSNKVIKTDDAEEDAFDQYMRLDRKYFSAGIINSFSWIKDYNRVRIKLFFGTGIHARRYQEMQYNRYDWNSNEVDFEPHKDAYFKGRFTLHGGLEVGLRY